MQLDFCSEEDVASLQNLYDRVRCVENSLDVDGFTKNSFNDYTMRFDGLVGIAECKGCGYGAICKD